MNMTSSKCILVVDNEHTVRELLGEYFRRLGYQVLVTDTIREAGSLMTENDIPVVLMELQQPMEESMKSMALLKEIDPDIRVILMTGYPTLESAICAVQNGAYYYVVKPFLLNELKDIVGQAISATRWMRENAILRSQIQRLEETLIQSGVTLPVTPANVFRETELAPCLESVLMAGDSCDALQRLGTLLKDGVITEDEFQSKKTEYLKRL